MTKGSQALASRVELDGKFRKIPGYENGDYNSDQAPLMFLCSAKIPLATANAAVFEQVIPFDYTIVSVGLVKTTAPNVNTAVNIGTSTDTDKFLDAYLVTTDAPAGREELIAEALMVATDGDAGDILVIGNVGTAISGNAFIDIILQAR